MISPSKLPSFDFTVRATGVDELELAVPGACEEGVADAELVLPACWVAHPTSNIETTMAAMFDLVLILFPLRRLTINDMRGVSEAGWITTFRKPSASCHGVITLSTNVERSPTISLNPLHNCQICLAQKLIGDKAF